MQIFGGTKRWVCRYRRGNVIWIFCVLQWVGIDRLLKSDDWLLCTWGSQQCLCLQFSISDVDLFLFLPKDSKNSPILLHGQTFSSQWMTPQRSCPSHSWEHSMEREREERQRKLDPPSSTKYSHLFNRWPIWLKNGSIQFLAGGLADVKKMVIPAALNTWLGIFFGTEDFPRPPGPTQPNCLLGPAQCTLPNTK